MRAAFVSALCAAFGLVALCILSLATGTRQVPVAVVIDAVFSYDASLFDHLIIHDYRLPRTLLAVACGAAFGVSGALIQAATRNPLADPGILGVNAGAAFFVTIAVGGVFGWQSIDVYIWAALCGAVVVTLAVYALGATGEASPVRLVLAGVALSSVLGGIGSSITLMNPQAFDALRMWALGSVAGRDMHVVATVAPFIAIGLIIAIFVSRSLNAVALGEDLANSLGVSFMRTRLLVVIAVTLLAGAATAAAGPIGFVGLMVPYAARLIVGPDQRWIVFLTMLLAPMLLLAADITGRLVLYPDELEAGIVTAFIGAPMLIFLARRRKVSEL